MEADEQLSDLSGRFVPLPFGSVEISASALNRNQLTHMKDTVPQSRDARLTISEKDWSLLRQHLLQHDGLERVAFLLVGRSRTGAIPEFLVHRVMPVQDDRCRRQSPVIIEPDTLTVLDNFGAFSLSSAPVFCHAHSHPFSGVGRFSGGDHAFLGGHVRSLKNYLRTAGVQRDCLFLRIVLGKEEEGFEAEVHDLGAARVCKIRAIRIVGATGIRYLPNGGGTAAPAPAEHLDRNISWLGEGGQYKVQRTRVAICGLGGVGAEVVKNLRGLGFRRYVLIDHDLLEATNLNRLPYRAADVGKLKVDLAASFIRDLDPEADIQCLPNRVEDPDAQRALTESDLIISGVDSDAARLSIQVLAARYLKPVVDIGSGIILKSGTRSVSAMGGQVSVYVPGGPCLACQGLNTGAIEDASLTAVRERVGYVRGTKETPASVVTINAIMAGWASDVAMRLVTGFSASPVWLNCDLLRNNMTSMRFARRENCPICGTDGVEGLGMEREKPLPPPVPHLDTESGTSLAPEEPLSPFGREVAIEPISS